MRGVLATLRSFETPDWLIKMSAIDVGSSEDDIEVVPALFTRTCTTPKGS
ncbi:hypothetical protein [Sulfitobacter delicatus]|nr:hypothetical protein [Sulfitobacter delicatus]